MMNRPFASDVQFGLNLAIFLVVGLVIGGAGTIAGVVFGILLLIAVFILPGGIIDGLRRLRARIVTVIPNPGWLRERTARTGIAPVERDSNDDDSTANPLSELSAEGA